MQGGLFWSRSFPYHGTGACQVAPLRSPLVGPRLAVVLGSVEAVPLHLEAVNNATVVLVELNRPTSDVGLKLHLAQERVLVFRTSSLNDVNLTEDTVVHLVVVTHEKNLWLFASRVGLDNLLGRVRNSVAGTTASVNQAHDGLSVLRLELDVVFHVTEVLEVSPTRFPRCQFHELPDVDTFVLNVPTFVVIARDEVCVDSRTRRPVLNEVIHLTLKAEGVNVRLRVALALNHVPTLVHVSYAVRRPDVEESVENVHTLILRAEVVVRREAELVVVCLERRRVNLRDIP